MKKALEAKIKKYNTNFEELLNLHRSIANDLSEEYGIYYSDASGNGYFIDDEASIYDDNDWYELAPYDLNRLQKMTKFAEEFYEENGERAKLTDFVRFIKDSGI